MRGAAGVLSTFGMVGALSVTRGCTGADGRTSLSARGVFGMAVAFALGKGSASGAGAANGTGGAGKRVSIRGTSRAVFGAARAAI
jgi:hypothetical protein